MDDVARLCQAFVERVPGTHECRWVEDVPGASDSAIARLRRERELARPVDPRTGPGTREVLLRYTDGLADLVTVTHHDGELERLRAALSRLDRVPPPDWGLGKPGSASVGRHEFTTPDGSLVAALGLVLARCTGESRVEIGVDPLHSLVFTVDDAMSAADYFALVEQTVPVTDASPAVGLTDARLLAPVHRMSLQINGHSGTAWFRHDSFSPEMVERFTRMLVTAHRGLVSSPDTPVGELSLLDERELATLGGFDRPLPVVPHRIEDMIADSDAVAVCFDGQRLTYRELNERANGVAHALLARGAGDRVGVCLERSLDLVVVLLGVLKAGAAYVPMDPAYPADRLAYTTEDAGLTTVITTAAFPELDGVSVLRPDELRSDVTTPPQITASPDDPAYVIYTSGSTGRPKGVVVPHRNVSSLMAATADFDFSDADVWTLFHSSAFDFSVWEIWGCLTTGGRLVVVPYWAAREPSEFARLLAAERVTVLNQTPSAFSQLMDERAPESLRLVVFGGEPLDTRPLLSWLDRHPKCRLVNMFGITETTVHVTAQTVTRRESLAGSRSVGQPLPGWHVYVLDPAGRPVPPGVAGEIYVGGAGVAGEYLNRPDLTAARFVPDLCGPDLMYRSGDRGRLLPDGRLEHLGRLDNQVKLRGFRIELDEIRARLLDAYAVGAAAVVLRDDGDSAGARLDAYVVFHGEDGDVEEVRRHAARFLPEHMVPSTVTALPALPLTPNGKVDVARLPQPLAAATSDLSTLDDADVEGRLNVVWEKVFGFRVSPDDDFFTLGGNSLLGVRLFAAMRSAGLPAVPLQQLYLNRTVRDLAAVLKEAA